MSNLEKPVGRKREERTSAHRNGKMDADSGGKEVVSREDGSERSDDENE